MTKPDEIIGRMVDALTGSAPRGWSRISAEVWASVLVQQYALTVWMNDGSTATVEIPAELKSGFQELRELMYEKNRGTWFSAQLDLVAGREHETRFNYDEDPQWWPDVPAVAFSSDLAEFPRDPEHIPPWLQEKLTQAETDQASRTSEAPGSAEGRSSSHK